MAKLVALLYRCQIPEIKGTSGSNFLFFKRMSIRMNFQFFHTVNTQVMLQYGFPQISRQIEIHMGSHIHQRFLRRCTVIFYYQIVSTEPIPYIIAVGTLWKSVHVMTAFQMKMQCLFLLFNMKQLSGYTTRTTMQMMTAVID